MTVGSLHWRVISTRLVLLAALVSSAGHAAELEQRVKAAILYNIAKFVEWPQAAQTASSIDFCIYGDTEFEAVARRELAEKTIKGRRVQVRSLSTLEASGGCHVVFFGAADSRQKTTVLLADLADQTALTVGDAPDFCRDGGMVQLKRADGKLRFAIAPSATEAAGLKVSSKLLRLAEIVAADGADP